MAEFDTSSYIKPPALPVQKSLLDNVNQYQQLESNNLTISKQKLDLYNKHFELVNDELSTLANDPKATPKEVMERMHRRMDAFGAPPNIRSAMEAEFAGLPDIPLGKDGSGNPELARRLDKTIQRAQAINERVKSLYGGEGATDNGQTVTPTRTYLRGGPVASGAPIQKQLPVDTNTFDTNNQPTLLGPQPTQLPNGAVPIPSGLPGQYRIGGVPNAPVTVSGMNAPPGGATQPLPVAPRSDAGLTPDTVSPNQVIQNRSPSGPITGMSPLFEEGKKAYTQDQENAAAKMVGVQPAIQALELMKTPGFNSGPGTKAFNNVIAAAKTWGLVDTNGENDPTVAYQQITKKLADYVSRSPVGQRSDAAQTLKEAASPNPSVQILPALKKLTEDAIALDRMEAARPGAFKNKNFEEYQNHRSLFPQSMDYRAFKLDQMGDDGPKLVKKMDEQLKKNSKDKEALKFFNSLDIAQKYYQ